MSHLTYAYARKLLDMGIEKAQADYGRPICMSICDAAGNQVAFMRMDDTPLRSVTLAANKAYTASYMGLDTNAFYARLQGEQLTIADFCNARLTSLAGGAVLKDKAGRVQGGIGISALKPEEDQAIVCFLASLFTAEQG